MQGYEYFRKALYKYVSFTGKAGINHTWNIECSLLNQVLLTKGKCSPLRGVSAGDKSTL